jgi:hypothetical protein
MNTSVENKALIIMLALTDEQSILLEGITIYISNFSDNSLGII